MSCYMLFRDNCIVIVEWQGNIDRECPVLQVIVMGKLVIIGPVKSQYFVTFSMSSLPVYPAMCFRNSPF